MWATEYLDGWVREVSCVDRLRMREVDELCVDVGSLAQCLNDAGAVPDYVHEDVAAAVIEEVGSEWCNPKTGRFWRRAQDCIKKKCSEAWLLPGARRMGMRIDNGSCHILMHIIRNSPCIIQTLRKTTDLHTLLIHLAHPQPIQATHLTHPPIQILCSPHGNPLDLQNPHSLLLPTCTVISTPRSVAYSLLY